MKIVLTVGHSRLKNGYYTSADGTKFGGVNEYLYNKKLAKYLKKELIKNGHVVTLIICPERVFKTGKEEKEYKLSRINNKSYDLCIELHLNASTNEKAEGCEVLYVSEKGKKYADQVQIELCKLFKNRGVKKRTDLYMLNGTKPPCIMLESFFCTNSADYKKAFDYKKIASLIASGIK